MKIQARNRRRRGDFKWQRKRPAEPDPFKMHELQPEGAGACFLMFALIASVPVAVAYPPVAIVTIASAGLLILWYVGIKAEDQDWPDQIPPP